MLPGRCCLMLPSNRGVKLPVRHNNPSKAKAHTISCACVDTVQKCWGIFLCQLLPLFTTECQDPADLHLLLCPPYLQPDCDGRIPAVQLSVFSGGAQGVYLLYCTVLYAHRLGTHSLAGYTSFPKGFISLT